MSEPLSKVFQLERKNMYFGYGRENKGYNQCLDDLDQLYPYVDILKDIIEYYSNKFPRTNSDSSYYFVIAKLVIRHMDKWIVNKNNP